MNQDEERKLRVSQLWKLVGTGDVDAARRFIKIWLLPGPSYFDITKESLAKTLVNIFLSDKFPKDLKRMIWKSKDKIVHTYETTSTIPTQRISRYNLDGGPSYVEDEEDYTEVHEVSFYTYITTYSADLDDIIKILKS
jgi:hypothetical protein